jgi:hypothetical protein
MPVMVKAKTMKQMATYRLGMFVRSDFSLLELVLI